MLNWAVRCPRQGVYVSRIPYNEVPLDLLMLCLVILEPRRHVGVIARSIFGRVQKGRRGFALSGQVSWAKKWFEAVAPDEPHKLARRIEWDGLSESCFAEFLNRGLQDDDGRVAWKQALSDCRGALIESWDIPILDASDDKQHPFKDIWRPIQSLAISRLSAAVDPVSHKIDLVVLDQMADQLLERLCFIGERVLWDRFRKGRTPAEIVLAHLGSSGNGSDLPRRAQYDRFVQENRRDGLSSILEVYPELGRLLGTVFALWLRVSTELLHRVKKDRDDLERIFSIPSGHFLCDIAQSLSDPHRGGQSVAILTFSTSCGENARQVVYKPKDLRVDVAYNGLLRELNRTSDLPPLRDLTVHACGSYGYMEHVSHQTCANDRELQSHYRNAGRLTAILHVLGCTDCHHENLIASGDQLVLVDTETLLEPDMPDHVMEACADISVAKKTRLQERFLTSVLRVGLLPQWIFLGDEKYPVDVSALGVEPPLRDTETAQGWLGINSDGMMPGKVTKRTKLPTSLPVGTGQRNPFAQYLDVFCAGFQQQCSVLAASRQSLLADGGALSRFAGLPRRIVLRATRVYSAIQRQLLEPAALRSSFESSLVLEQMARSYLMAEARPRNWPVLAEECSQMQQLDIPFFTHLIDGDALILNDAGDAIPGFFYSSGFAAARDRLGQLSAQEIDFQLDFIRGSVHAQHMQVSDPASQVSEHLDSSEAVSSSPPMTGTEAANRIARELCYRAIHDPQGYVEWLGPTLGEDGESFSYGPVGLSLYSGSIGVALLLHRLCDISEAPAEANSVRTALLRPLHELVAQPAAENRTRWWRDQSIGLSGCGGILLALEQLEEKSILDVMVSAFPSRFIEIDFQRDLLGGSAGLIGPMLRIGSDVALDHAIAAGEHLLRHQTKDGGWPSEGESRYCLGFAHGTAGCAAALAALYHVTGHARFLAGAAAALALERAQFCDEVGNWPTHAGHSPDGQPTHFLEHWCNGAPGIALGRACLWETELWDDICAREIEIAVRKLIGAETRNRDHLCCGNLGLMSVLRVLSSGPWPLDEGLRTLAKEKIRDQKSRAVLRCNDKEVELRSAGTRGQALSIPGYFNGLSGMGLSLLEGGLAAKTTAVLLSGGLLGRKALLKMV